MLDRKWIGLTKETKHNIAFFALKMELKGPLNLFLYLCYNRNDIFEKMIIK